jgi:hypothetical protein
MSLVSAAELGRPCDRFKVCHRNARQRECAVRVSLSWSCSYENNCLSHSGNRTDSLFCLTPLAFCSGQGVAGHASILSQIGQRTCDFQQPRSPTTSFTAPSYRAFFSQRFQKFAEMVSQSVEKFQVRRANFCRTSRTRAPLVAVAGVLHPPALLLFAFW